MFYGSQKLFCPVHPDDNGFLGARNKNIPANLLCDECQFYFYFPVGETVPTKATKKGKTKGIMRYCDSTGCICH